MTPLECVKADREALARDYIDRTIDRNRYRAAFEKYGQHLSTCTHGAARELGKPCTCGFSDLFAPTEGAAP